MIRALSARAIVSCKYCQRSRTRWHLQSKLTIRSLISRQLFYTASLSVQPSCRPIQLQESAGKSFHRSAVDTVAHKSCSPSAVLLPPLVRLVHSSCLVQYNKATVDTSNQNKVEVSRGDKIIRFIGWLGGFYSRKAVLTRSAKALYESCVDTVQYEEFFNACSLPDTFQSWFLIAHLHVWLCLVRLKRERKDGSLVIREVVSTFWYDVEKRMNVLGVHSSGVASWSLRELTHEFYGLTIAYEEGLLSDDKTLAAALWRNLIHDKSSTDPTQLARLVEYVRSQVKHMDGLDSDHLLTDGRIKLLPFI